jgi:glycosyltransferase involved in cell wall biosynthesis
MKVAVVTPIPTPYRDPFWNVVAGRGDIDLAVFYCAQGKRDRPWAGHWQRDYRHEVLPGRNLLGWNGADASLYYNPQVTARLRDGLFDAVLIGGYNHPTMLLAIRFCRREDIPYFLMCESHLHEARSAFRRLLKDHLVHRVVANMAGGFPTGTLAEQYLLHYGADEDSLVRLPNAPDVEAIREQARELRHHRDALRRDLGLSSNPTLLFAGRLIRRKGAHLIIEAMAMMEAERRPDLVIAGAGPERARLDKAVGRSGLGGRIRFVGFLEPPELVRWYVAADVLVMPSVETWGVVVTEALAAGTPVIVSDRVGCHPDVVGESSVGRVVPREDVTAWCSAIAELIARPVAANAVERDWAGVFDDLRYRTLAGVMCANIQACTQQNKPAMAGVAQ